ncbi:MULTISPECIES: DMT family transporter [unclassified Undibacterium]|uniref:DMT family transporter n=1 Tax=unclassified Undibacterium TaxID=2630295 RepID=UPI002AC9CE7A|nr:MULTISPECIES: DMT family transporter [unclassified Undibacterium]MEB0140798.1 DMT family transporter [Undibacterium sp. CCC2.1]MEB0173772.1 DMT family transporter [Undibacterium sp. CCC1.1]MEB0177751.1 DMT family transporter [Undibacterium sp. CCC3.4]MEB0216951.1 DMT family transporter [Undibacterium sp. 5I2]WPX44675.1 DMT family transporter [Undibacterium sp. CCC3.4]
MPRSASQLSGLLAAIGAGLLWGLVFITPVLLPDYSGVILSFGRYLAFGLIAILPAAFDFRRLRRLRRADWYCALRLSLVGNMIYYAALASAIQLIGAPIPTMLIGTLPVVIAISANLLGADHGQPTPWKQLAWPLSLIFCGLMLVNVAEFAHPSAPHSYADYWQGTALALLAVAAWTWYPLMNSRHLKANTALASSTWATAQGLCTLPLALLGFAIYGLILKQAGTLPANFPLGDQGVQFISLMLVLGFFASWLGTLLWNHASHTLPASLSGQLIVFETLAALSYTFILRQTLPPPPICAGVLLLCVGVALALRRVQASAPH